MTEETIIKKVKFADRLHLEIHALRLLNGYKPTQFETRINAIVSEVFADECPECKERIQLEILQKKHPMQQSTKSWWERIIGK